MKISVRLGRTIGGGAICLALLFGGCTKYASQDDLKRLDEAQQAAVSAESEQARAESERHGLEGQVAAKQTELDSVKTEFERVKARSGENQK